MTSKLNADGVVVEEASGEAINEATSNSKVTKLELMHPKDQIMSSVVCPQHDNRVRGIQGSLRSIKVLQAHHRSLAHRLQEYCNDRHPFKVRLKAQYHLIFANRLPTSLGHTSISPERIPWHRQSTWTS